MSPSLTVYVENHHTRDPRAIVTAIRAEGLEPRVMTDRTNFYTLTTHARWQGNFQNYLSIVAHGAQQPSEWVIVMQDDVSVPPGLFDRIGHVLAAAPGNVCAFYVAQNNLTERGRAAGVHVIETFWNYWIQCMAFRRAALPSLHQWGIDHVQRAWDELGDGGSDDDFLSMATLHLRWPVHIILPSFVQHDGAARSLMKTAAVVAGRERVSGCYAPTFDATSVDWARAFAAPLRDRTRHIKNREWAQRIWRA